MHFLRTLLLFLTIALFSYHGKAQQPETAASLDSTAINEAMMVQEEQQKRIDSLVKVQLQRELTTVSGNLKRTAELEARLRKIAVSDSLRTITQMGKLKELRKKQLAIRYRSTRIRCSSFLPVQVLLMQKSGQNQTL